MVMTQCVGLYWWAVCSFIVYRLFVTHLTEVELNYYGILSIFVSPLFNLICMDGFLYLTNRPYYINSPTQNMSVRYLYGKGMVRLYFVIE